MSSLRENDFQEALDNLTGNSKSYDEELDSVDEQEISHLFKSSLNDYKRLYKRCSQEGAEIDDEFESYKDEYITSSPAKRLQVISELRQQIQEMISICEHPPKDIMRKYSEDLVTRIENGIMDGFEIEE